MNNPLSHITHPEFGPANAVRQPVSGPIPIAGEITNFHTPSAPGIGNSEGSIVVSKNPDTNKPITSIEDLMKTKEPSIALNPEDRKLARERLLATAIKQK